MNIIKILLMLMTLFTIAFNPSGQVFANAKIDPDTLGSGMGFDIGYGGAHSAPSIGINFIVDGKESILNHFAEMGVALIGCAEGVMPKGTHNYPCPHSNWIENNLYKSPEIIVTLSYGIYALDNVVTFAQIGYGYQTITQIQQSTATGYYYKGYSEYMTSLSYGAGLRFIIGEREGKHSKSIKLEYNNRRGISLGYGATFSLFEKKEKPQLNEDPQLSEEEKAYWDEANAMGLAFFIPEEDVEKAWGRAQSWIGKYSSMKIQIVTDYIIQTYNPTEIGKYGYYINREPKEGGVNITIECISPFSFFDIKGKQKEKNARILAYYIKTGKLPDFAVKAISR